MKALTLEEWIIEHKLYHFCIQDTINLSRGDVLDVAIFDANMEEYGLWDNIPRDVPVPAAQMFRFNRCKIVWLDDRKWSIHFPWDTFEHPLHYNLENLATNWNWAGVDEKGIISVKNEIIRSDSDVNLLGKKSWELNVEILHPLTRIGWRGPIMFWKYIEESRIPVYWK